MMVITTYAVPIGDVAIIVALGGLLVENKRIRLEAPLRWFGIFVLWCAFGTALTRYPALAVDRTYLLAKLWIVMLVALAVLDSRPRIQVFLILSLLFFATYPARGAIFNFLGGYNYEGRALWIKEYANPNQLGALTLLQLALAFGLLFTARQRVVFFGAIASLAVLPIVILMTGSRGVFIALVVFTGLVLARHPKRGRLLMGLSVVALIAVLAAPEIVWKRVGGLSRVRGTENLRDADTSAEQRWEILQASFRIISDYPVVGTGPGTVGPYLAMYDPHIRMIHDTHSTYVNVLLETGIIGLVIFVGLLGTVLRRAHRALRSLRQRPSAWVQQLLFAFSGLIGFLVAGIWGTFTNLQFFYIYLAIVWSLTSVTLAEAAGTRPPPDGTGR
jgi:probable O-glycosylation ligase (exosortase A-associated)